MPDYVQQKFNDDLLVAKGDRDVAAVVYPTVFHVLDHPELRQCFLEYDAPSNAAKKRSVYLGSAAILLASAALISASGEIPFHGQAGILTGLALVAAVCGIASVLIGALGLLYGKTKRNWLCMRLMTERLRQFHFQTFVYLLPEITASVHDEDARARFVSARAAAFAAFRRKMEGHLEAELSAVIHDEQSDLGFRNVPATSAMMDHDPALDPLFEAYRELRIEHQLNFARFKMREDDRLFSSAPRSQAATLERVSFSCIVLLLALHITIGTAIVLASIARLVPTPVFVPTLVSVLGAATLCIAVVALAARTFQQGLQPERELERYAQYGSSCKAILDRFDGASSHTDKVAIMREMERLSVDEMRNFFLANQRATFVM